MIKTKDKLKKLNDYVDSASPNSQKVPAVIPDKAKNAYFSHSDIAPKYTAGNNIKIEDGIISKKDTTYTGDDHIVTVDPETKVISARDAIANSYYDDRSYGLESQSVYKSDNQTTHVSTFSLYNTAIDDKLSPAQKKQPTYRAGYSTKFAGHSNKNLILLDPFWEADHLKSTGFTRVYKDRIIYTEINGYTSITREYPELQQVNQIEIHQHNLLNIYFDYEFFVEHYGKEVYITKTISTDIDKGCKFFITNSGSKKLLIYIYSCGVICSGNTTPEIREVCLQDIAYPNWQLGQRGSSFNYVMKPFGMNIGYTGNTTTIPAINNKWYDEYGQEAVVFNPIGIPPIIMDHYNFYKPPTQTFGVADPRYEFYDYNARKISCSYTLKSEASLVPIPLHTGTLMRPDGFYPESKDEYFSSFKFIIAGIDERNSNFNILYLVDSRF